MIPPRMIIALIGIALVVALLLLGPAACRKWQNAGAQSRVNTGQASAAQETGRDAIGTVSNRAASDADSEALSRANADRIRAAKDAATRAPEADFAGRTSLCKRPSYANDPQCSRYKETPR